MAGKINEKIAKDRAYGEKSVRTIWDSKTDKMWFCVKDVMAAVTNTQDIKSYLKKVKRRDAQLDAVWDKIMKFLEYKTSGGRQPLKFVDLKGLEILTNTIRPNMSEPFKKWAEKQQAKAAAK